MILDILLIFLCVFLLLSCVFWAYLLCFVFWYKVPLISTQKSVVKKMVDLAHIKEGFQIYELGCGFAPMLFLAAKKYPQAQFFGVEVLQPICWYNRLKNYFLKYPITFLRSDFFKLDLSSADVIFCYLWDSIMAQIYTDMWPKLKRGAMLISHDFPIKDLTPVQVIKVKKSTIYVYVKG